MPLLFGNLAQYANDSYGYLVGNITGLTTTIQLNSTVLFPPTGNFLALIDDELMLVVGISGNFFTVMRGLEGTNPVPHSDGALVVAIFSSVEGLNIFRNDTIDLDTVANRDNFNRAGRTYIPSDGNGPLAINDNIKWNPFGLYNGLFTTPLVSNFPTTITAGSSSFVQNGDVINFLAPSANGASGHYKSITPPFTVTAQLNCQYKPVTTASQTFIVCCGLASRRSTLGPNNSNGLNVIGWGQNSTAAIFGVFFSLTRTAWDSLKVRLVGLILLLLRSLLG